MRDWYRRTLAPVTPEAWAEIDSAALRILKEQLSARKLVDLNGPHGAELGALNLGRLEIGETSGPGEVPWGLRTATPLVETRIPIVLKQMELDNISRGCSDPDLGSVEESARKLVLFEETAIFRGFEPGKIKGIIPSSGHSPLSLSGDADAIPGAVSEGVNRLKKAGIGGPYALVLGEAFYFPLMQAGTGGYPPHRIIRETLEGEIYWSPALEGGVLLSTRGGDFELVLGEDASIGYAMHDRDRVELYLTESFTFRTLEPAAAVALTAP